MIALVFWNSCSDAAESSRYADALAAFHQALNREKPNGFRFSLTLRTTALPWFNAATDLYEDWYLLSNFAAIDALNDSVLHAPCQLPHQQLMRWSGAMSGAIYTLAAGAARKITMPNAHWLIALPDGNCCAEPQHDRVRWTRSLGLGPAAHCILSDQPQHFPAHCRSIRAQRTVHWSPFAPDQPGHVCQAGQSGKSDKSANDRGQT